MSNTALAVLIASFATTPAEAASTPNDTRMDQLQREMRTLREQNAALAEGLEDMRRQNRSLQGTVTELQAQSNEKWLSAERAEQIRGIVHDVIADSETRASLSGEATQVGYGAERGFFIATPDGNFKLNLGGQLQLRYAADFQSTRDNETLNAVPGSGANRGTTAINAGSYKKNAYGFEVRRMKLDFFGHVIDPSWQYRVVLIYVQNQNAISTPGGNNNSGSAGSSTMGMEEAMVIKDLGDGMKLSVGQFKSPFLREEITSSRRSSPWNARWWTRCSR
ncbi:MAG: porin, partial [Planctomycetota bacterium]